MVSFSFFKFKHYLLFEPWLPERTHLPSREPLFVSDYDLYLGLLLTDTIPMQARVLIKFALK